VLGANQKVSNLMQILPHASHDLLIVNDGDIRVAQDYVSRIAPFFSGEKTGLVTCLYRGVASKTLSSKLESLGISTDFAAGVLVAHSLEGGISFGLGSTLAFKRSALDQIGGFAALADYLADDYEIGRRIHHAGYKVELADFAVETFISPYSFGGFFRHQIRWARTIRDARPAGYAGLLFTFGLPWAMLCAVAAMGAPWSLVLLTIAVTARLAIAILVGQAVLNDSTVLPNLLWLPLRDLLALGVWFASFFGNKIWWGETDYILKRGKLAPAARS
jgi:ceramide glucosyltransferase